MGAVLDAVHRRIGADAMVKIGWLQSNVGIVGGAEMSAGALVRNAPEWAEIVYCPPNKRPPEDIDVFCLQNQVTYGARWIEELALKPVIKHVRDPWYAGSSVLRRWLLDNADLLIFSSPVQVRLFDYPFSQPHIIIPPPVNLTPFREAALPAGEREGTIFAGRADVFKGAHEAVDWALRNREKLDVYGDNRYMSFGKLPGFITIHGEIPYHQMPHVMGRAKRYFCFPMWPEAFGRTVAEAWAAGCELLVDEDRIGACWWIKNKPGALEFDAAVGTFWEAVEGVASGA